MFRNLDDFSAALSQATAEATAAASTSARVQQIVRAHAAGDHDTATRIAAGMTTAELQAAQQHLRP